MRLLTCALLLATSVAQSQGDTTARSIPAAVVTAKSLRGPADTVRNLERAGFYDRRISSGAPEKAFVTEIELKSVQMLSELVRLTGRQLCKSNVFLDGKRVNLPDINNDARRRSGMLVTKDGIDALIDPWQVAGVEFYKPSDTPPQFKSLNQSACGATLIWTK